MGIPVSEENEKMNLDPSHPSFDINDIDVLDMLDNMEEQLKGADCFVLKYTVIHDEWGKRTKKTV